ncbi:MAG: transcription-repair coupling factor [Bacteroidetes bacterium]|nr:transcription-repair coupling factor [Bacteroidota bacterium]
MNLEEIVGAFGNSPAIDTIVSETNRQTAAKIQLRGLAGSAGAFFASAVIKKTSHSHLFILPDKESAAYFLNDLEEITQVKNEAGELKNFIPVLFFPSSYRKAYQPEETDNANVLLRAEVLDQVRNCDRVAVVTYPGALSEKVVTKKLLEKNTLPLKRGEKISIAFVTDLLHEYGFDRNDYVYEAGQFAVRGGIVDVFSYANEFPYRVEFSGDDVESIRTFDPSTQLSVKNLDRLTIIPNVQGKLLVESRETFLQYFAAEKKESPHLTWIWDMESAASLVQEEFDIASEIFESQKEDSPVRHLAPSEKYCNGKDFQLELENFSLVECGNRFVMNNATEIPFNISPQSSFRKNFDLLTQALAKNSANHYHNIIFTDGVKQSERLHSIFEDIGRKLDYVTLVHSIHEGFIDHDLKIACYTDHQIFERYHRFRLRDGFQKNKEAMSVKELRGLNPGDFVVHIDHGVGRFGGLEKIEVNGKLQEAIRLVYRDNDVLYVSIHSLHRVSKYSGKDGNVPRIDKIGSVAWQNLKQKTKSRVREIAFDLIKLYAARKAQKGFSFSPDNYLQNELEASFIYEDTPDQLRATQDVKRDMEDAHPMDRLVCGDVGFGKTEIAIRAAFKAVCDSKQVAVLVPTTILALQHYKTFSDRLKDFPAKIEYLNRFRSAKEKKEILHKLGKGEVDILIGTHTLAGKEIIFRDLGLMIVDEEQKFGVAVKDKLKTIKTTVDTLTLTATPIPRTLQFSLMSARDLSIINTAPPNRFPVQTELHTMNEELLRDAIRFEIQRGGQIFFVHNRVSDIFSIAALVQKLIPDAKVAVGHGQMQGHQLEKVMLDFVEGQTDVLVSTTIIESGLDISNANTIIINDAQNFGLSDLHQMRGRVGRSNKKAFCYLITPPQFMLTAEAQKRLRAIEEFSDLGSGFQIAMRDLDIRGAGNLLGGEQSGFISDIGFDMYQKILDEAIRELKETEFKELFKEEEQRRGQMRNNTGAKHVGVYVRDTQIDTDLEILIPDEYVHNITERLSLYRQLDDSDSEDDLVRFENSMRDRFGPLPQQVTELIDTIRLRWMCMDIGFERLVMKNEKMAGYFIPDQNSSYYQSESFTRVLKFIQNNPRAAKMKELNNKLSLSFENVKCVKDAMTALGIILK